MLTPLALGAVVGALVIGEFQETDRALDTSCEAAPDRPPGEYLFLDTERVHAYLGQIENGLTARETRTESEANAKEAALQSGLGADVKASRQRQRSVEKVVTAKATDRFFTLLKKLRCGREQRDGGETSWLHELDAGLTKKHTAKDVRSDLFALREGDFVRIRNAHLFLPPYAAVVPKARYAASYTSGKIREPKRPLYAPIGKRERNDLDRYLTKLGADPGMPFVLPTLSARRDDQDVVTFFVPSRYTGLVDNARLLAGNLTVVGKVIYKDPRLPGGPRCPRPKQTGVECRYFDRQTLATFAPALRTARPSMLASLGLERNEVVEELRRSVTFRTPVVVVLPVAIYQ